MRVCSELARQVITDETATYSWLLAGECERIQGEMIKHGEDSNMCFILTRQPLGPVGLLTP